MTFGERLKESRLAKKMTQKQLADQIGAKHNSISDWENNKNKPDPDTIELICGALEITPNYLLATTSEDFSPSEKLLIKKYRTLDEHGKKMVDFTLSEEYKRCEASKEVSISLEHNTVRLINYYYRLASAGSGQILFDTPPTKRIEIPNIPEYSRVDYAVGVNGKSMEPTYNDGDTLLIEMTEEINVGENGIFLVDGECYVKKLGEKELISLNSDYRNIPLNETARCMGRVIGKF